MNATQPICNAARVAGRERFGLRQAAAARWLCVTAFVAGAATGCGSLGFNEELAPAQDAIEWCHAQGGVFRGRINLREADWYQRGAHTCEIAPPGQTAADVAAAGDAEAADGCYTAIVVRGGD